MAKIFFSYSHRDEALRDELEKHMAMLKEQGLIESWHDRRILAGQDLDPAIDENLQTSDVILLLVSSDFLASRYCYGIEMKRALQRREAGQADVVPVILRDCDWQDSPLGGLLATPKDGKPIERWAHRDEALLDVVRQIKTLLKARTKPTIAPPVSPYVSKPSVAPVGVVAPVAPRSSNLRLKKTFSDADKDAFREETFEFMARFFENSLAELQARNHGIEGRFRRIDAHRFTAIINKDGKAVSRCTVRMDGSLGRGISWSGSDRADDGSFNEMLTVEAGDHEMHLKALGMASFGNDREKKLSQQGAAELYWDLLIRHLR